MGRKIDSVLKGFTAQKCLTLLKLTTPRITVSRNRRNIVVRQMRGEIAQLLKSGQASQVYDTKIDSLIKEESMVAAYDLLDHFCNSIISQFPIIETQRYCPSHLKEPIATLIYAAPRCMELAELNQVKDMLTTKYGKEFAIAAEEIQPECGVNRQIIELLALRPVSEQTKVKKMREVCVQHHIEWRPEWAPNSASDLSNLARVDYRRAAKDDGNSKSRPTEVASSSRRASNLVQDVNVHPLRGSRHGEGIRADTRSSESMGEPYKAASPGIGPNSEEEVRRANLRVSEGVNEPYRPHSPDFGQKGHSISKEEVNRANASEPYKPGFGAKHSSLPKEELPKANMKVSEGVNEPYRPSPRFGSKIPKDEVTTANTRVSAVIHEPFQPVYGSKHSPLSNANMKVPESMDEPYNPGFGPWQGSIPREEVPKDKVQRANIGVSEGIYEPNKPTAASFGNYKAADYKQDGHEDRAEYRMHHDEISDSGSEVFVSVEDDEVGLSYKDEVSATVTQNDFDGNKEDRSRNPNIRARSLRASRETNLSRERSSLKASPDSSLNAKQSFKSDDQTGEEHYTHRNKWAEENSLRKSKHNISNEPRVVNNVPTVEEIVHKAAVLSSDPSKEEKEFASTARAIAAEAARLAVLDYARRYSRSGSVSLDLDDLPEDTVESMTENVEDSMGSKRESTNEKYNRSSSKTAAPHDRDYEYGTEYQWDETDREPEEIAREAASSADVNPFARKRGDEEVINQGRISKNESNSLSVKKEKEELERSTQRRRGEKPKFDNEKQHNFVDVDTRFNNASKPIHNRGKPVYDEQGKSTEGPTFDQAAYRDRQFFEESTKPRIASSMSEKRPIFDEEPALYFDSAHRRTYSQEMSDKQYRSSYANQMNHDISREPMRKNHGIPQHEDKSAVHIQAMRKSSSASLKGKVDQEDPQDKAQLKKTNADANARRGHVTSDGTTKSPARFAQRQQMTNGESDADGCDDNWDAASATQDRENSIRARRQTDSDKWEATRAEDHIPNRREVRSSVKMNKQTLVAEQDEVIYEEKHVERVQGNNQYKMSKQSIGFPQQDVALKEDKGGAMDGQGHAMSSMSARSSKINHRHSEKNILDEVLSAKWHGDAVSSAKGTQNNKMENIQPSQKSPSSYCGMEGTYTNQDKSHEWNKPVALDSYVGQRIPLQQEHHEIEPDLVSLYTPRGQIHDLVNRGGPSNSMSVRQKSRCEDIQVTASGYKPCMEHDSMGRRTRPLQKQEEQESASKSNVADLPHRQGKVRSEQNSWLEKEQPQNHKERQKPTADQLATGMSPNHRHEQPTRKPPALPQKNASISDRSKHPEATWGQQYSPSRSQKKQVEEGAYERNSAMVDRRSEQPTRPPPQVRANVPTANDRESLAKLNREELRPPTRQPPVMPTRRKPSPLVSDPVISGTKPPLSSMPSASESASVKLASSSSVDTPDSAAPKGTPKFPHVDDIAANLDALYQAAKLRKPN